MRTQSLEPGGSSQVFLRYSFIGGRGQRRDFISAVKSLETNCVLRRNSPWDYPLTHHTCVCIHTCLYIYIDMCAYIYISIYIYTYTCACFSPWRLHGSNWLLRRYAPLVIKTVKQVECQNMGWLRRLGSKWKGYPHIHWLIIIFPSRMGKSQGTCVPPYIYICVWGWTSIYQWFTTDFGVNNGAPGFWPLAKLRGCRTHVYTKCLRQTHSTPGCWSLPLRTLLQMFVRR